MRRAVEISISVSRGRGKPITRGNPRGVTVTSMNNGRGKVDALSLLSITRGGTPKEDRGGEVASFPTLWIS